MTIPLCVLATLSTVAGFLETPHTLGHVHLFSPLLGHSLPALAFTEQPEHLELVLQIIAVAVVLAGISLAWCFHVRSPRLAERIASSAAPVRRWWLAGWGFDALYDRVLVRPLTDIAKWNHRDFIDSFYEGAAQVFFFIHLLLSRTQNGKLRWYAAGISAGTAILLLLALLLR